MSTLRVSNIEAKADVSSPSVHEKIKVTNSEGDVLVHIDGATSGISTVGINTTVKTFDVDSNQNIDFVGNLTAPNITVTGTLSYDDVTSIDSVGVITARNGLHVTGGNLGVGDANPSNELVVKSGGTPTIEINGQGRVASLTLGVTANESKLFEGSNNALAFGTNNTERLRITSDGQIGMGIANPTQESGTGLHIRGANGGQTRIHLTNSDTGDTATDGFYIISQGAESGGASGEVMLQQKENKALKFATNNTERLRIKSDGDVYIGNIAHSNEGGANSSYRTLTLADTTNGAQLHLRGQSPKLFLDVTSGGNGEIYYDSGDLRILSGEPGGTSSENLRINATAELIQTSATNSTNSWYSLNSNNTVTVTNGDNDIYIERVGGSNGYDQLVYKKTPMTDNCDISFRLSGSQPGGTWRHLGITICGDGGSNFANMDRIVIRQDGASGGGSNRIRVDKAGGGTTADVTSPSIPSFFDGTERNVLIQIRGNIIHVLSDNVLVFSEQMNAALHSITGFFGIGIYETSGNIRLRNFQITNYGALGVPQKRPCLQTNMSDTYGSSGSLTTNTANTGILQASAYIDLCGNYTTSGSNAYTFECPVDGVYAVNAHISMGGGSYGRHIWVMSYTMGGGNLPLGTYTEVLDLHPDTHSNHSYYNLWKFTKGTRIGMGINSGSGSLPGKGFQWGIMLVS